MDFENIDKSFLYRLSGLLIAFFLLVNSFYIDSSLIAQFLFLLITGVMMLVLLRYVNFLKGKKGDNDTLSNQNKSNGQSINIDNHGNSENSEDKENYFQYLKNIIKHVGIGLITFNKEGEIQILNTEAKRLLNVNRIKNIEELNFQHPELVNSFRVMRTGGKELVKIEGEGEVKQLAIFAIQLTLKEEEFKLISLQNIQSELEEKEMEAWQNLVRVLTHEIMNSITPITSLSNLIEEDLRPLATGEIQQNLHETNMEDILLAVQTIKKRSTGLVSFVQDFRSLTHIPSPKFSVVKVDQMINEIVTLLSSELKGNKIQLFLNLPEGFTVRADKDQIVQVVINLMKNAIQSFDENIIERKIWISGRVLKDGSQELAIKDNGSGIEEEALGKIFIPFFTTKKHGSGIGLSLSRQIMRKHNGSLSVKSRLDEGTEFSLKF